jgi:hypothetical protein
MKPAVRIGFFSHSFAHLRRQRRKTLHRNRIRGEFVGRAIDLMSADFPL